MAFRCADWPAVSRESSSLTSASGMTSTDRIHNPRAPPLRAPAAELPVSPSPTVP